MLKFCIYRSQLNDSHTQLIIHWAGQNSECIVALTKGHSLGNSGSHSGSQTSSVFVSTNYGRTFRKLHNMLIPGTSRPALISQFYNSPVLNSHYFFTDEDNHYVISTHDFGQSVTAVHVPFRPTKIVFHPSNASVALGMDKDDHNGQLYITENFGRSWQQIQRDVHVFYWENKHIAHSEKCIYICRSAVHGVCNVIKNCNFFSNMRDSETLIEDVETFEMGGTYMFATKHQRLLGGHGVTHQFWLSYHRQPFRNAEFPHSTTNTDFYVADTDEDQVLLCVTTDSRTHLYVSRVNDTKFSLSLQDVLYFNPDDAWSPLLAMYVTDPFADIHRVEGMRGVYIATQLINKTLAADLQRSLITYDKGGEWQLIVAPERNIDNTPSNCSVVTNCSLHLTQAFSHFYASSRANTILSKESAPGLIAATGNTGTRIQYGETLGLYISTDAGYSWHEVLKGLHSVSFADHGGVIVAVAGDKPTNELVYSTDEGKTWHTYNFSSTQLTIYGMLTEPGEKTTVLVLFGSTTDHHSWMVISVDLSTVFQYTCSNSDYKPWSLPDNTPFQGCLLGRKTVFERRIPHTNCYNGHDYEREKSTETCSCTREDFECDYGYKPSSLYGSTRCVPDHDTGNTTNIMPSYCPVGTSYPHTRGYTKIGGDTCTGGDEHKYAPLLYSCKVDSMEEFILIAQDTTIYRHMFGVSGLEVLVNDRDRGISAVDFAYEDSCLFWADDAVHNIKKLCLDGNHPTETLHSTSIGHIVSISYDWRGRNLYWLDSTYKVIEVSKETGLFRRELIKGTPYIYNPKSFVVDPHHGWMFWTDAVNGGGRISRASMDGAVSSVTAIFNRTDLAYLPSLLTIDPTAELLYWSSVNEHSIMSCDLNGKGLRVVNIASARPSYLSIYKNDIYWVETMENVLYYADSESQSRARATELSGIINVMDMKIMHHTSQHVPDGNRLCDDDTCPQLCLLKPSTSSDAHAENHVCRCGQNATLSVLAVSGDEQCCAIGVANCSNPTPPKTCSSTQFRCQSNGHCIPSQWRCDHDYDCPDGSDEDNCAYASCSAGRFACNSGRCIPNNWRCDFDYDCKIGDSNDTSDEANCSSEYPTCSSDEFTCTNGRCINMNWRCDFDPDCSDGSDERDCRRNSMWCEDGEFVCPSGIPHCVQSVSVCDGRNHCSDGADERNCTGCSHGLLRCGNGLCVDQMWRCDGKDDCGDNTDEAYCTVSTTTTRPTTSRVTCNVHSYPRQFQCANRACVDMRDHCDGIDDCGDWSDEQNCGWSTTSPSPCRSDMFQCRNGRCLPYYQRCNGFDNCGDRSDEDACHQTSTSSPCGAFQFTCYNSRQPRCIYSSSVCDGQRDCYLNEDETNCQGNMGCNSTMFFKCQRSEGCIPRKDVCNAVFDCPDHSDEAVCFVPNTTVVPFTPCKDTTSFRCRQGNTCIPYMYTCNGKVDCPDQSDENLPQCLASRPGEQRVMASDIQSMSVFIKWSPYSSNSTGIHYIVSYLTQLHGSSSWHNRTNIIGTSFNISHLHPAHAYDISVYVNQSGTVLPPYHQITVTTMDGLPGPPIEVHTSFLDMTIIVSWYQPIISTGHIQKYRVYIIEYADPAPDTSPHYVDASNNSYMVTIGQDTKDFHLQYGARYWVWVTAFTSRGEGRRSTPQFQLFDEKGITAYVGNIKCTAKGNHSIVVSWTAPPKVKVTNYTVVYYDTWGQVQTTVTTDTTFEADNLCSSTSYGFVVSANNEHGSGPHLYISSKTKDNWINATQTAMMAGDASNLESGGNSPVRLIMEDSASEGDDEMCEIDQEPKKDKTTALRRQLLPALPKVPSLHGIRPR